MTGTNELGEFLKLAREQKGLTLRAVEKMTAISNAYLSQIESGKIKQPSPNMLYKLCEVYNLAYAEVMKLAGYPAPDDTSETSTSLSEFLGPITDDEETALREYLAFLRSRRSRKE